MARVPKKTYSRINCELHENEKENVDPFDELLSSPLKQEVQFKPLSFWRNNVKKSEPQKNSTKSKYKLYESDDPSSPCQDKKKRKNRTGKGRSKKQGEKCVHERSRNDSWKSVSYFKLEKYLNSPCLIKNNNAAKTTRINHDGYVTLRRPFNVNMPVTSVTSDISGHRRETGYDSRAEKEFVNDCDWKHENEFNAVLEKTYDVVEDESTACEESEKSFETPKELCKSLESCHISRTGSELRLFWNDSLVNDSLEFYQTTTDSGLDETKDFLDNSETFSHGEVWLTTSFVLDDHLSDETYVIDFERSESKDAEKEFIAQSDSLLSGDISDLTNLVFDMTISNETVEEETLVNSSCESFQEKSTSRLQLKALPVDDKKEDCSTYVDECRNVTRRRPGRNRSLRERVVSDLKSVDGNKHSETFTLTKIQENSKEDEDEESSFKVPKTLKSPECKNEISLDSSRLSMFAPPIFESTRFIDVTDDKEISNVKLSRTERMTDRKETLLPDAEHSVVLKSGKKWQRSMSLLKQIQNGNFSMDDNKVKGRRFDKFIQETLEMQTDNSYLWTSVSYLTISNGTLMNKTVSKESSDRELCLFKSTSDDVTINEDERDRTVLPSDQEKSKEVTESKRLSVTISNGTYMNRTAKVIPSRETSLEKPSLLMSVLGLHTDGSVIEDSVIGENLVKGESSVVTPRDFILLQCGQEDVLPFEDYFNERTLKHCKKIGEGVYGEVFMYNSDTVLKIIPIEGEDRVNGEPQKKFEEILSEVVIASTMVKSKQDKMKTCGNENERMFRLAETSQQQLEYPCLTYMYDLRQIHLPVVDGHNREFYLSDVTVVDRDSRCEWQLHPILSNLRNGERYRTSGFSELKRCWCVVGKYPKYLLDLWNEYDQSGNGSENDSPVMFKSDQLYIVLELANGGKDLEAFVFNSAEQSLSVFIQTAFSLAAAEKAFEFEHRDLHWGNLLIAHTKDKFMTVVLDGIEYKIPTKGVKVSIIDFTLSRVSEGGCCIFNDLSVDPSLFNSQGDYQFEIYRMMQRELTNDWSLFRPRNNLFWLHYTLDKMLKMVRYKNKNTQVHKKSMKELKMLESIVLEYDDSSDFVINEELI